MDADRPFLLTRRGADGDENHQQTESSAAHVPETNTTHATHTRRVAARAAGIYSLVVVAGLTEVTARRIPKPTTMTAEMRSQIAEIRAKAPACHKASPAPRRRTK